MAYKMDCSNCGRKFVPAQFDKESKSYTCKACGQVDKVIPETKECPKCHNEYVQYTWFDPAKCPSCGKNFAV
jgi:DNA-directed RNA polymerase subunit RPC12/RpoP